MLRSYVGRVWRGETDNPLEGFVGSGAKQYIRLVEGVLHSILVHGSLLQKNIPLGRKTVPLPPKDLCRFGAKVYVVVVMS